VAGADETGYEVNGDKYWIGAWQTKSQTFIAISPSRGFESFENNFPSKISKFSTIKRLLDCFDKKCKRTSNMLCSITKRIELFY